MFKKKFNQLACLRNQTHEFGYKAVFFEHSCDMQSSVWLEPIVAQIEFCYN